MSHIETARASSRQICHNFLFIEGRFADELWKVQLKSGVILSHTDSIDKYKKLIGTCDDLIKSGQMNAVANLIGGLNLAQVPRVFRQPLAKICRRAGQIEQGLRLLQPIIRSEKQKEDPATDFEINEYAVLLSRNGSNQESLNLLEQVDPSKAPETLLYQAFCHILNWDYGQAVGLLEKFLESSADLYTQLIARVNLGSSYLSIRNFEEAQRILLEAIDLAKSMGASRLIGNCLELLSQVHLQKNEFQKCREVLDEAGKIFGQNQSYDSLLVYKWKTIMTALETRDVGPLLEFRREAIKREHWESVREADLFSSKIQFDQKVFDSLYFGTPMKEYRKRIQLLVEKEPSSFFLLGQEGSLCLDLDSGRLDGADSLNPGKKTHQVLGALMRDFYVPRNIGTLFAELYPNEFFDVNSSPLRVRQALSRTRKWLDENQIPVSILQSHGSYRLQITGSFGIRIPLERDSLESSSLQWKELKKHFPLGSWFTATDACEKLQISKSSFYRLVQWASDHGEIEKIGKGKATRHQILNSKKQAA